MTVKGEKRKIKNRKKKRRRKRKENENLLEMVDPKRNLQRRRKKKFLVNRREIFRPTSFTSETIVKRSLQIMLVSVSLKLPKFLVLNGKLSVPKKKLHMKKKQPKIKSDMPAKWTNSKRTAEKSKFQPNRRNLQRRRKRRLHLPRLQVQQRHKDRTSHKKRYPMIHQTKNPSHINMCSLLVLSCVDNSTAIFTATCSYPKPNPKTNLYWFRQVRTKCTNKNVGHRRSCPCTSCRPSRRPILC